MPWDSLTPDDRNHVRFLLHALALRDASQHNHGAARKWERLLALQALPQSLMPDLGTVWKVIQQVCSPDISLEDVSYLLRREACNSFGIMAPTDEEVCFAPDFHMQQVPTINVTSLHPRLFSDDI